MCIIFLEFEIEVKFRVSFVFLVEIVESFIIAFVIEVRLFIYVIRKFLFFSMICLVEFFLIEGFRKCAFVYYDGGVTFILRKVCFGKEVSLGSCLVEFSWGVG